LTLKSSGVLAQAGTADRRVSKSRWYRKYADFPSDTPNHIA
jgi:hypothetical protein